MKFPHKNLLACAALAALLVFSEKASAQNVSGEPTNAAEAAAQKAKTDKELDEKYQTWKATLAPERQAWETTLEANLGNFYLPRHKADKVKGRSNVWDYIVDEPGLPRVLIIGDSISRGYTMAVRQALKGKANVHRAPANCGPTANGINKLAVWLSSGKWDLIHFNFGIHDRKTPEADYQARLTEIVERLQKTGAKLIWASSTPLPEVSTYGSDDAIVARNAIAAQIMANYKIPTNDLYAHIKPMLGDLQTKNDVHYNDAGYAALGKKVSEEILASLATK